MMATRMLMRKVILRYVSVVGRESLRLATLMVIRLYLNDYTQVDAAIFTSGDTFKKKLMAAQKPGMNQADQARAVLKTFVAAEEEEQGVGGGRSSSKKQWKQKKNGLKLGSQQQTLGVKRPRPMMTITTAAVAKRGTGIGSSSSSSIAAAAGGGGAALALKKGPLIDPLADYEAMDEEEYNSLGLTIERRRKIIKRIFEASTDADISGKEKEEALRQIREIENDWYSSSKTKEDYQKLAKEFSERLYNN